MGLSIKLLPAVLDGAKGTPSRTRGVGGVNGACDGQKNSSQLIGDMPDMRDIDASGPGSIESLATRAQAAIDQRPGPARRIRKSYDENKEDGQLSAQGQKGPI